MLSGYLRNLIFILALSLGLQSATSHALVDPCQKLLTAHPVPAIYFSKDFEWDHFTAQELLEKTKAEHEKFKLDFAQITQATTLPTFKNTVLAVDNASNELVRHLSMYSWFDTNTKTPEIVAIQNDMNAIENEINALLKQDLNYFKRVEKLRTLLTPGSEEYRIVADTYRSMIQEGVNLPADEKQIVTEIKGKLADLATQFQNHMVDYKDDAKLLRTENEKIVLKTIELRGELAKRLGFESYAEMILSTRMAESADRLREFYSDLIPGIKKLARKETKEFREFKADHPEIEKNMVSAKMKESLYHLNETEISKYFEFRSTVRGTLRFLGDMFEIDFVQVDVKSFAPGVTVLQVLDRSTKKLLSEIHLDLFARPGKKTGAWKSTLRQGGLGPNGHEHPIVGVFMNIPVPKVKGNTPLLNLNYVRTLLHELGHALHDTFSTLKYKNFAGTQVKRDFVEFPSQLMENWLTTPEFLSRVSKHYQTKETLPNEWIKQIRESSNFLVGTSTKGQLRLGLIDFSWHSLSDPHFEENCDLVCKFERDALKAATIQTNKKYIPTSPTFQHVFSGGYAMGYYGYMWAKMMEHDGFEYWYRDADKIHEKAMSLRKNVLAKGGLIDPNELYRTWKGEDFSNEAFLKDIGLTDKK